jgi:hypothetical protein
MQMFVMLEKAKPDKENIKLSGGQAYECSSDWADVLT